MQTTMKSRRRGTRPAAKLAQRDYPFTMKLPDGRTVYVEVPGRFMGRDRDGSATFGADAMRFLDRIQALAMSALDRAPSPGYLTSLREALGLTQKEFGDKLGVDKMTVSRWERGALRPGEDSLAGIEKLRREAATRGVVIPG
jgi:DNA-binding transcriptional regulator YiaG